jgi:hypothetical protein
VGSKVVFVSFQINFTLSFYPPGAWAGWPKSAESKQQAAATSQPADSQLILSGYRNQLMPRSADLWSGKWATGALPLWNYMYFYP